MKKIVFMRHGFLEKKYNDYSKLNRDILTGLLTKEISPNIDVKKTNNILMRKEILSNVQLIFCSEQTRAIQTAELITTAPIIYCSLLNEINFEKGVIGENLSDFSQLREEILLKIIKSEKTEKLDSIKKRIYLFFEFVSQLNYQNILCITHGWLMRLIKIYCDERDLGSISLEKLKNIKPPNFLDTIVFENEK